MISMAVKWMEACLLLTTSLENIIMMRMRRRVSTTRSVADKDKNENEGDH